MDIDREFKDGPYYYFLPKFMLILIILGIMLAFNKFMPLLFFILVLLIFVLDR
jgi:hypothetical protein